MDATGRKCTQLLANAAVTWSSRIARPDAHPSMFTDQKRAVDKAKRSIEECEHKLQQITRWTRELDREAMLFQASMNRLNRIIEGDLERGTAWLETLLDHLANYINTPAPKLPRAEAMDTATGTASRRSGTAVTDHEEGTDDESAIEPTRSNMTKDLLVQWDRTGSSGTIPSAADSNRVPPPT